MKLTHDAHAALERLGEAALEMNEYTTPGTMAWSCFAEAVKAYRATQAPKECRPPSLAKDGSLWWLHRVQFGDQYLPARWMADKEAWTTVQGGEPFAADDAKWCGWTVHSECRFGETGVEATRKAAGQFITAWTAGKSTFNEADLILDALTHFRAPKLEISDEELRAIIATQEWFDYTRHPTADEVLVLLRAVIAKAGGEK